jgi:hypothetical protein
MSDDMAVLILVNLVLFVVLACGLMVLAVGAGQELYLKKKPFVEEDHLAKLDRWWKRKWGDLCEAYKDYSQGSVVRNIANPLSTQRPIVEQSRKRIADVAREAREGGRRVGVLESSVTRLAEHRRRLEAAWRSGVGPAFRSAIVNALCAYDEGLTRQIKAERERLEVLSQSLARLAGAVEALGESPQKLVPPPDPLEAEDWMPGPTSQPPAGLPEDPQAIGTYIHERLERRRRGFAAVQAAQDGAAACIGWARDALLPALDRLLDREDARQRIKSAMEEAGVREIAAEPGERSDGSRHEEIAQGAVSERYGPGQILQRVTRGYEWDGIVIRRAQVVVAANTLDAGPA